MWYGGKSFRLISLALPLVKCRQLRSQRVNTRLLVRWNGFFKQERVNSIINIKKIHLQQECVDTIDSLMYRWCYQSEF